MLEFALSLNIVLPAAEVPHEVAPIHEITLIREEEAQVLPLRRHLHVDQFATIVVGHQATFDTSHPALVGIGLLRVPHTRKQHVLCIHHSFLRLSHEVFVALTCCLGSALIDRCPLLDFRSHHTGPCDRLEHRLRRIGLTIEERSLTILVACQIGCQREDILGGVLVHRRIGCRTDEDNGIAAVSDDEHQKTEQGRVPKAFAPSRGVPKSPRKGEEQNDDIEEDTCVERTMELVDEQQFEPPRHFHDARDDAIEYASQQHERHRQRPE